MKNWFITREPYLLFDIDGRITADQWMFIAKSDKNLEVVSDKEFTNATLLRAYKYQDYGIFLHVYNRIVVKSNNKKCLALGKILAHKLGANFFEDIDDG